MGKTIVLAVAAFLVGGTLGYVVWLVIWSPLMVFYSGYPEPWEFQGGSLVINDFFGALGKIIGFFVLPIAGGVVFAKTAVEWDDRRARRDW